MKRPLLILLACILLITLALGLSRSRLEPPLLSQPTARTKLVPPDESEVVLTLRPVIITVPAPP